VRFAGQITGTEGYLEAAATGLLSALNTFADAAALPPFVLPETTALGALVAYATNSDTRDYQPMHVNFGLVPPLAEPVRGKRERYAAYSDRALRDLAACLATRPTSGSSGSMRSGSPRPDRARRRTCLTVVCRRGVSRESRPRPSCWWTASSYT